MKASNPSKHRWRFFRAGGLDQVKLETSEDYCDLADLDLKLWVALACPVKGTEFDEKTLELLDRDKDGRVRAPEIIEAVEWTCERLKDPTVLKAGTEVLALDQIEEETEGGRKVLESARQILANLGKADATSISLAEVSDTNRIFAQTRFNGDGVVPMHSSDEPGVRKVLLEIADTQGTVPDRSGEPGITQAMVDAFFEELKALDSWGRESEVDKTAILPLGDATPAADAALQAVRSKIDDYFARTRLAAFDPRALGALNRREEEYLQLAAKDMHISGEEIADFPLARIEPSRPLPLREGINPAWTSAIDGFVVAAVTPILGTGRTTLTEADWAQLQSRLAPFEAWNVRKPKVKAEPLGIARAREILATPVRDTLVALIEQDKAVETEVNTIADVERLIRYHRDLHRLLNNFVNFSDFYSPDYSASFQSGTLYIDARACELCIRVGDAARHASLAALAKTYLAYCDCSRPTGEKMVLAVAITNGDSDNLMVGRNGLFYDRLGRDWDATITKIIENPISIRQAFWAPYKKLVRLIEEQVAKRAAAADASNEARLSAAATTSANVDKVKPAEPKKIDVGTVAALGVAFGAIGGAIATITAKLMGLTALPFWQIVLALLALVMIASGPSVLIAWLKLRQRNLGPILDANGWAVNGRVKVPVALGRSLTKLAKLPAGTIPAMDDKFAEPPVFWPKLIGFVVAVGFFYSLFNYYGFIYKWSDGKFGIDRHKTPPPSLFEALGVPAAPGATNAPAATNAPPAP